MRTNVVIFKTLRQLNKCFTPPNEWREDKMKDK